MKHLVGIGVLVATAFLLRSWLQTSLAFDIYIHDAYRVVPFRIIAFWCLIGTAVVWLLLVRWASIRRHS